MQASENTNDDFLFIDDSDGNESHEEISGDAWKVLIVDDDPEIHSVTKLALSDLIVLGSPLEYLHAYSGEEACKIVHDNPDIVLVLLDVVMETDDAGLNVVKHIRKELDREDIRIVLRTGQPGYAPEESVIKDYDINDYKTKTELTRRKLVTTVYAAIRSYQQINIVSNNRKGLEKVILASAELLEFHSVQDYVQGVLTQLHSLSHSELSLFCARGHGIVAKADDLSYYILGQQGASALLVNQKLDTLKNDQASRVVNNCFIQKQHYFSDECAALYISSGGYRAAIYLQLNEPIPELDRQLIEVFLSNISIGYENVHLFQKLSNAAYKDLLTGLPNRLQFLSLLDDFCQSDNTDMVAALIDINHFSDINDGLGQEVGNQLLIAVATRLKEMPGECALARVGADVFGIIGPARYVSPESILALFHHPFIAGEQHLPANACVGFCKQEHAGSRGVKALSQINIALNLAKKERTTSYGYYKQEMEDKTLWRLGMIRQLRTDFAENRLELWYQPQLMLETGKVIGAEALLRWRRTDGKFISPAVFIPLAEYSGLIIDIGDWVINQACQQIKHLEAKGFDDVGISVNVSIPQFRQDDFVDNIITAIDKHDVESSKLELEITENVLMDEPQVIIDALEKLKAKGLSIALDDFGTGFSSLSYLQKLPLDRLKVDRAFVTDIAKPGLSIIADTIINLGKQMGLTVIAEGIEEIEQEQHLKTQGCHEVQGFYYAKPMPMDEFLEYLHSHNANG
ncbi:bifunctional diguanylate cyclase/phosphodiesterase [Thalassotalea sp. PLHSN55]|uniref:bifunctional diguanylate cyclase/phosphodiesterase n=1 Tax=Thalassotalea sp. PLHSN55 TaxID=3435888 RepID=UPI003F830D0C